MNVKEIIHRIALASISQPVVSIPPYRGNLLEYIKQRQKEEDSKKVLEKKVISRILSCIWDRR